MKESLSINRIDQQEAATIDSVCLHAASVALQSELQAMPWQQRLRPVSQLELRDDRPIGLVALDRNDEGGYDLAGHVFVKPPLQGYAEVSTLYVEPGQAGQGIGGALVEAATRDTILAGWTPAAFAANPHAQRAFEQAGYRTAVPDELPMQPYNPLAVGYVYDRPDGPSVEVVTELEPTLPQVGLHE